MELKKIIAAKLTTWQFWKQCQVPCRLIHIKQWMLIFIFMDHLIKPINAWFKAQYNTNRKGEKWCKHNNLLQRKAKRMNLPQEHESVQRCIRVQGKVVRENAHWTKIFTSVIHHAGSVHVARLPNPMLAPVSCEVNT